MGAFKSLVVVPEGVVVLNEPEHRVDGSNGRCYLVTHHWRAYMLALQSDAYSDQRAVVAIDQDGMAYADYRLLFVECPDFANHDHCGEHTTECFEHNPPKDGL